MSLYIKIYTVLQIIKIFLLFIIIGKLDTY